MANIAGTYFDPSPGRLQITFSGTPFIGSNPDAGHASGDFNVVMCAVVNGVAACQIDFKNHSAVTVVDYPGGVNWAVSTVVLLADPGGANTYGMKNLSLILELTKK